MCVCEHALGFIRWVGCPLIAGLAVRSLVPPCAEVSLVKTQSSGFFPMVNEQLTWELCPLWGAYVCVNEKQRALQSKVEV